MEQSPHNQTSMPAVTLQFFRMPLKVKVCQLTCYIMTDLKGTNQITRLLIQRLWSCALRKVNVKHDLSLTGVDEDVIVAVLVKRNNEQRQKIKVVYEASTGEVSRLTQFS